ncbi:hypothetical protein HY251_01490 [bacterium]|nr:hypothetical protein [bacterium]
MKAHLVRLLASRSCRSLVDRVARVFLGGEEEEESVRRPPERALASATPSHEPSHEAADESYEEDQVARPGAGARAEPVGAARC